MKNIRIRSFSGPHFLRIRFEYGITPYSVRNVENAGQKNSEYGQFSRSVFFTINLFRSSHQRCFVKDMLLKKFAQFTGKLLCRSLFLIRFNKCKESLFNKCKPDVCNFIKKRESVAGFFLWILRKPLRVSLLQNTSRRLGLPITRVWTYYRMPETIETYTT